MWLSRQTTPGDETRREADPNSPGDPGGVTVQVRFKVLPARTYSGPCRMASDSGGRKEGEGREEREMRKDTQERGY